MAHGYVRLTADVDIILDMDEKNLEKAMQVFKSLGYRPRAPVEIEEFINIDKRKSWMEDKGMTVFSLWNPDHPATEIVLFLKEPIPFEDAYKSNSPFEVSNGVLVTVIGFDDLIKLKRKAGRPRDLDDIERLKTLRKGG